MSIRHRCGLEADFDKSKMSQAEFAITTDTKKAFVTFAPNDTKQLLTSEDSNNIIALSETMTEQIDSFEQLVIDQVGINDSTATLTQAYSGSKTQGLVDVVNTNLALSSTVETQIGTWDGVPRYHKRITYTTNIASGSITTIPHGIASSKILNFRCMGNVTGDIYVAIPHVDTDALSVITISYNSASFSITTGSSRSLSGGVVIDIEYIK